MKLSKGLRDSRSMKVRFWVWGERRTLRTLQSRFQIGESRAHPLPTKYAEKDGPLDRLAFEGSSYGFPKLKPADRAFVPPNLSTFPAVDV